MSRSGASVKLFAGLFFVLASLAIYQSGRVVVAEISARNAEFLLRSWYDESAGFEQSELKRALEDARRALSIMPSDADYNELIAELLLYGAIQNWSHGRFVEETEEVLLHFAMSSRWRPRRPHAWARYALVKAYRGEVDASFLQALENAVRLGPEEAGVQVAIAEAGLFAWRGISVSTRKLVAENVYRGLRFRSEEMRKVIERYDPTLLICGYLPRNDRVSVICRL